MDVDLDGYFDRIGYAGPHAANLETLHAITRAHAQTIPFENVDVLLGHPIEHERRLRDKSAVYGPVLDTQQAARHMLERTVTGHEDQVR